VDSNGFASIGPLLKMLSAALADTAEPVEFLRAMLEQVVRQTGADRAILVELSPDGEPEYRVLHRIRPLDLESSSGRYSRGVFEHVRRTGEGIRIDDARRHPEFMHRESISRLALASILCAPVLVGGRIVALVHLEHDAANHFAPYHEDLLRWLADVASPMFEALQRGTQLRRENKSLRTEVQEDRRQLAVDWSFNRFVGTSQGVRALETVVRRAGATEFPVLLLGENGTGKNLVARILHALGARANSRFVTVTCPNLPANMIQVELFGCRKGAYTDAPEREGKVPTAAGGTLFLDEIGDLPLDLQSKLLQLLQDKTYEVMGEPREYHANVRVIAATNCNLERRVLDGTFRRDLFERLNYVPVVIPPLRERREDIPLLMRHCLDQTPGGRWIQLANDALEYLEHLEFGWPGNVRNLEQLAARLVVHVGEGLVSRDVIEAFLAPALSSATDPTSKPLPAEFDPDWKSFFARQEREWMAAALQFYPNHTRAELARALGIAPATVYRKLKDYGLME